MLHFLRCYPSDRRKLPKNCRKKKQYLIDFAFPRISPRPKSFADLCGVWNIEAAYTFYTLRTYEVSHAFLLDTAFTNSVRAKSKEYTNPQLLCGNFGDSSVVRQITKVDVIFLFGVRLHQVEPDWDQILEMYAPLTNYFLVFNQQFITSEKTVRLLDLGVDQYFENVPHDRNHPIYQALTKNMYDIHPEYKRTWRDVPDVWQWGIR